MVQDKTAIEPLPEAVACDEDGCNAHFISEKGLKKHEELHVVQKHLRQQSQGHQQDVAGPLDGDSSKSNSEDTIITQSNIAKIQDMAQDNQVGHYFDVEVIKESMSGLYGSIYVYVAQFFDELDVDQSLTPVLELTQYKQSLVGTLTVLYVEDALEPEYLQEMQDMIQRSMSMFEIVISLVAGAVTKWALNPRPQGHINFNMFRECVTFISGLSKPLSDNALVAATKTHLERDVKPRIENAAHALALRAIDHPHALLLQIESQETPRHLPAQITSRSGSNCSSHAPKGQRMDFVWPPPTKDGTPRERLVVGLETSVLGSALHLRLEMEVAGDSQSKFFMPTRGENFRSGSHNARDTHQW